MPTTDDIVARATNDLQRAEREAEKARALLERAQAEIADLQAFMRTMERYVAPVAQEGRPAGSGEHAENKTPARPGTTARLLVDACYEAIEQAGHPIKIGDLLDIVLSKGFTVGGRDQKSNLAGSLSRDPRLVSRGRTLGWDIVRDEEAASEPGSEKAASSHDVGGTDERSTLALPDDFDLLA